MQGTLAVTPATRTIAAVLSYQARTAAQTFANDKDALSDVEARPTD
jgi:hypothetical protein